MDQVWGIFMVGVRRTLGYWQILVIFYGTSLIAALPLTVFPASELALSAGRTSIQQAANGLDAWLIIESLLARVHDVFLGESSSPGPDLTDGVLNALLFGLIAIVTAPLLVWVSTSFLSGGVLLVYIEAARSFQWRRFLWGCWRWFGVFLLLGLIEGFLAGFVLIAFGLLGFLLAQIAWEFIFLVIILLALVTVFGLITFEMTRLAAVARNTRNLWQAFLEGLRLMLHHGKSLAGLYILALGLLGAIHGGFRLGIMEVIPLAWWPLALVSQQVFIFLRLWARSTRLAGGAALFGQAEFQHVRGESRE